MTDREAQEREDQIMDRGLAQGYLVTRCVVCRSAIARPDGWLSPLCARARCRASSCAYLRKHGMRAYKGRAPEEMLEAARRLEREAEARERSCTGESSCLSE